MKIQIEGTPEEIAQWARTIAQPQPCPLPHYPLNPPLAPVYPLPSWPWDGPVYTTPGITITCADAGRSVRDAIADGSARHGASS